MSLKRSRVTKQIAVRQCRWRTQAGAVPLCYAQHRLCFPPHTFYRRGLINRSCLWFCVTPDRKSTFPIHVVDVNKHYLAVREMNLFILFDFVDMNVKIKADLQRSSVCLLEAATPWVAAGLSGSSAADNDVTFYSHFDCQILGNTPTTTTHTHHALVRWALCCQI